jgi:hypothetical protein
MDSKLSKPLQAASCVICAILTLKYRFPLDGSEFMRGTVTGPILNMCDIGTVLFLVASPMAFLRRRQISGAFTLLASLLCLPLYLYFTAPGPFRWVFRGDYKVPRQADFVWERWSIGGIFALSIAASFTIWRLLAQTRKMPAS